MTEMNTKPKAMEKVMKRVVLLAETGNMSHFDALPASLQATITDYCFSNYKRMSNSTVMMNILKKNGVEEVVLHSTIKFTYFKEVSDYAPHQLLKRGVVVTRVINFEHLKEYQEKFLLTVSNFPEYKPEAKVRVLGGFGAFGNPSSFHNAFVRNVRAIAFDKAKEIFKEYNNLVHFGTKDAKPMYLQCLFDRMMYRHAGQAPMPELWHRDISDDKGGEIFGGWINFDSKDQHFSCIPGSHINFDSNSFSSGFVTLADAFKKESIEKDAKTLVLSKIREYATTITIPPGFMIIFPQYILHEVQNKKCDYDMMRVFTGWRLTSEAIPLVDMKCTEDLKIPKLPGSMLPMMYSKMHLMNFQTRPFQIIKGYSASLQSWCSDTFVDEVIEETGFVNRHMKGMKEYCIDYDEIEYGPYFAEEREIYEGVLL